MGRPAVAGADLSARRGAAALAAAALVVLGAPAQAETWHGEDAAKDVRSYRFVPKPPPCGRYTTSIDRHDRRVDITGLDVDHGPDTVTLTLSLREVVRNDRQTEYDLQLQTPGERYEVQLLGRPADGLGRAWLSLEPHYGKPDKCGITGATSVSLPCDGLSSRVGETAAIIEVDVPRSCLDDPTWVRVGVDVYGFGTVKADGQYTGASDQWGRGHHGVLPPYGPRVHSS